MAESHMRETNRVYVDTSLDTHLLVLLHDRETISDFKVKLCKEHHLCFPELGEIDISAVKVNRQNTLGLLFDYHLPDSVLLSMVFNGIGHNCWFVFVDAAVKVPRENCLNHELLEKDKNDSLLLDGYTLEEDLEADKTTKKRELELSAGEKSLKKQKFDLNQSSVAAAGDSVAATPESLPATGGENLDDSVAEATQKENELVENSVDDVGRDQSETDNLVSHTANHLDTNSELTTRPDTEKKKRRKKRSKDQSRVPIDGRGSVKSAAKSG